MDSNQITQKEIEDWIARLKHDNYQVRYNAARMLGDFGDTRAITPLIEALGDFDKRDDESRVNRNASSSLLRIGEVAIPPLIEALKKDPSHKEDEWRRYWVAETLKHFRDRAVELLIAALDNKDSDIAGGVAKILRHSQPSPQQTLKQVNQALQKYEERKAESAQARLERRMQRAESRVSSAKVTTQSNRNELPELDEASRKVDELTKNLRTMDKKVEIWQQTEEVLPVFLIETSPEIRTPLTAILGYADILLSEQEGNLTTEQTEYIVGIRQCGLDLLEMFMQHLDDGTYDKNSLQFRTSLTPIWGYVDILLDGQAGALNERQVRFLVGLRENTQSLSEAFEYIFDMYQAATDDLFLKIGDAIDISQLVEQVSPDEVELRIPQHVPKVYVDKNRLGRAIAGFFNPFYYEDTILELTYDDLWIRFDIFTKKEVFESDYLYPNPGLFYGWRIIEKHGGQMTYELRENGTQLYCSLPIFQNKTSD